MIVLAIILNRDRLAQIAQFNNDLGIVLIDFDWRDVLDHGLNLVKHVSDQNRVISGEKPARLLNNSWVGHIFVFANLLDGIDNVVSKLLRTVIRGGIKRRLGSVIVHGHAAAYVQQFDGHLHLMDLCIDARRLLHRVLDAFDVGQLRLDVKVQQSQHIDPAGIFQAVNYLQELGGG